jgi:molecular chaperone DnaK
MVKDAEVHSTEDKKRREVIDAKNHADQLVYSLENLLRDNKDKISDADAEKVRTEIEATKKAIETENIDQIKAAVESLTKASHKLTEMMYQQASQQQAAPGAGPEPGASAGPAGDDKSGDGDVIDAEVVDDDKKK